MKIGYRTLKTAIGTPVAIFIAQLLQLENYISAGILVVLCIKVTRKRSVIASWHRFAACLLGMLFCLLIFESIGYHPLAVGVLLLLFIPTTVKLKITEGIVTSSVIILHLYGSESISLSLIINEVILISVGIGTALLLNLYMPSLEDDLRSMQERVESNFTKILKEVAHFLESGDESWTGKEINETADDLEKARSLAYRDVENHLLRSHHTYYHYFKMRSKQFEILERMLPLISRISAVNEQAKKIAIFFDDLAEGVHPGNTAYLYLDRLKEMRKDFRQTELPKSREEFEIRASLFTLLNEIEQYLIIKKNTKHVEG
ncbi:aromatic acid exporter family protein [Salinibacillus xinjiangensis]|uniref:Aromatic acid exporter family protein n=1 Tax=Salinibacillus xinjiangensis TaxID=1229268 RepID=A0A6G1X682_9BACI|nr:aromatic acid exporter family protein [Salinibacillus xinjiangensis]MRG86511.1 aromatic acid exporter family protein [Salinibacillus xinjiangensis]